MRLDTLILHTNTAEQIVAIKANDDAVLRALYHANYYKVENFVLNNNGSAEHARDIFQEAFIAVWRSIQLDKFYPENETALTGYLFTIAKNKWLDHLRSGHHKKVIPLQQATVESQQEEALIEDENEYVISIKNNFKQLGENCKEVLTRFYYHKEPLKTIAKFFGWTEATARNNKYRCLQRLRELIKNK